MSQVCDQKKIKQEDKRTTRSGVFGRKLSLIPTSHAPRCPDGCYCPYYVKLSNIMEQELCWGKSCLLGIESSYLHMCVRMYACTQRALQCPFLFIPTRFRDTTGSCLLAELDRANERGFQPPKPPAGRPSSHPPPTHFLLLPPPQHEPVVVLEESVFLNRPDQY